MISRNGTRAVLAGLLALALVPASASAAPAVNGEFNVSSIDGNAKLTEGPDGNIWVALGGPDDVARINPKSGEVKEFDLGALNGVSGIAAGPDKKVWISESNGVTSFSPGDPEGTKQTTAIGAITGNHAIVAGPDGNLWVATAEALVRIPPANPEGFTAIEGIAGLAPRDIDAAAGMLLIADFAGERILAATPEKAAAKEFTEYKLKGNTQGVAGAPDGQIAFSAPGANPEAFGLLTPPGPPSYTDAPNTDPFGVALGPDGAFWVAQAFGTPNTEPGTVTRFAADGKITTVTGFAKGTHPRQIAAGPEHTLWVTLPQEGAEEQDKVARVSGVEAAPTTSPPPPRKAPETTLGKGPKGTVKTKGKFAKVSFRFSSSAGAGFECRLNTLGGKKAKASKKAPGFTSCKSPKAYKLKPGRYSFEVRAVLAGLTDTSPAKRSFKVVHVAAKRHR